MPNKKAKKKFTKTGWIGKDEFKRGVVIYSHGGAIKTNMQNKKGSETDWYDFEWPPVKVRVTVEEV